MMAGSLFAAFAFAGANQLFKLFDGDDHDKEVRRHNLAMEDLTKAKEKWYEAEVLKKDEIARKKAELISAQQDIAMINKTLDNLSRVEIEYNKIKFSRKPELKDFYKPSEKMKYYESMFIGATGVAGGMTLGLML